MPAPLLRITDGTTSVSLIARSGFFLEDWTPLRAPLKGGGVWAESPLADGRRLRMYRHENTVETFTLKARHGCQDDLIADCQNADRLLLKALDYHVSDWLDEPVWLEARGPDETNTRYALIHAYVFPQDDNPYAQPFFTRFAQAGMDELTLVIEHGPWLSLPPGQAACVEIGAWQGSWEVGPG